MIDGKRLKFGYGDISIGGISTTRQMSFQQFKPPAKVGDNVIRADEVEWIGEQILVEISFKDYQKLCDLLGRVVSREISEFVFKDYIFDFTNYNETSVEMCRKRLSDAMSWYFLAMAC